MSCDVIISTAAPSSFGEALRDHTYYSDINVAHLPEKKRHRCNVALYFSSQVF